ncbi:MAG: hypothetical protein HMLIMOIP_002003 [Candidatus Nitrosomirales archaeon]|jgi:hypothetical protein
MTKTMQRPELAIKKSRTKLIIGFIVATLAVNSIILLSGDAASQNYFGNILRPILAAVATTLALIVVCRQKLSGIFGRSYAFLAGGLVLYLIAEVLWGYFSIGLGIEVPFPSLADTFWLAAYGPFGYGLFSLFRLYSKQGKSQMKALAVVSLSVAAFSSYYILQLLSVSDLTEPDAAIAVAISIAYPILDSILIIPALLVILSSGKGYLTSVPWIFVSWIFTAIADGIFGFTAVTSIAGDISIWNVFYNAAYLSMAAGLFWHNRYMIFDTKRVTPPPPHVG